MGRFSPNDEVAASRPDENDYDNAGRSRRTIHAACYHSPHTRRTTLIDDLTRTIPEFFRNDGAETHRSSSLRLADLLYYGDFEIVEQVVSAVGADRVNVVGFRERPSSGGGLLLTARLDSEVEGRVSKDGRWFVGTPSASGPLCLLCMLVAASRVSDEELRRPLAVAGTFFGPRGTSGARYLVESGHVAPDCVLVGAPTSLDIGLEARGQLRFLLSLEDHEPRWRRAGPVRSALRARVPDGAQQSLLRTLELVDQLGRHGEVSVHGVRGTNGALSVDLLSSDGELRQLPGDVEVQELAAEVHVSAPMEELLRAWNAIATELRGVLPTDAALALEELVTEGNALVVHFAVSPPPGLDPYEVFRTVDDVVADAQEMHAEQFVLRLRATANLPAMERQSDSQLVPALAEALAATGLLPVSLRHPEYSEAGMYASCGIDTAACGPGRAGGHPSWRVPVVELDKAVDVYEGVIRRLCT